MLLPAKTEKSQPPYDTPNEDLHDGVFELRRVTQSVCHSDSLTRGLSQEEAASDYAVQTITKIMRCAAGS